MKYICTICGYVYDEEKEGKAFSSLPDNWVCPLCGAPKSAFKAEGEKAEKKAVKKVSPKQTDLKELSSLESSSLFSNLARGAEKQAKNEESKLFLELADYFKDITPNEKKADIDILKKEILKNLDEDYPYLDEKAKKINDRGTLRVMIWGTKITRMQDTILSQYREKGEDFLKNNNIYVCTVCGFIYIGKEPPALCPVCRVPDWKFEKIGG